MSKELIRQIVGAGIGIAIGLMILFIGFFRTLLLVLLAAIGWWVCGSRQIPPRLIEWLSKLPLPGKKDDI